MSLKQFLADVDNRISLAQLVGKEVKLTRRGREFVGLCPFHNEKTPSFSVIEDKKFYHCFGCGKNGRAIDWFTEKRGLSFREGLEELSKLSGVPLPAYKKTTPAEQQQRKLTDDLYPRVMAAVVDYYRQQLSTNPKGKEARAYLRGRGLEPAPIDHFALGYAPDDFEPQDLLTHLEKELSAKASLLLPHLMALGVVRQTDGANQKRFLLFRGRIMFPITNRIGKGIGFGGRFMGDAAAHNTGKYINSPDSPVFAKGQNLYNLQGALTHRDGPEQKNTNPTQLLVVEGYMDVIALHQAGIGRVVAPLGTALTEQQLQLLWRSSPNPIVCFDGDEAGQLAAFRALKRALPFLSPEQSLQFVFLPRGEDPDSLVKKAGRKGFEDCLASRIPLHEFLWQWELNRSDLTRPEGMLAFEQSLMAHCQLIADLNLQRLYRETLRDKLFQEKRAQRGFGASAPISSSPRAGRGSRGIGPGIGHGQHHGPSSIAKPSLTSLPLPQWYEKGRIQQRALLALFTIYPHIYKAWLDSGGTVELPRDLDNYLKTLHRLLRNLSTDFFPRYQDPNPTAVAILWLERVKEIFQEADVGVLWGLVFDNNLWLFYPQLKRGDEQEAMELVSELTHLETVDKLQKDFRQQILDPATTTGQNDARWEKRKFKQFAEEMERMEQSLQQLSMKEKNNQ
ncbi:MAG: DNA primase [Alphaproteobacteria bacterium]|nr:DNA primase [Alphaproteobacteria bacterium]